MEHSPGDVSLRHWLHMRQRIVRQRPFFRTTATSDESFDRVASPCTSRLAWVGILTPSVRQMHHGTKRCGPRSGSSETRRTCCTFFMTWQIGHSKMTLVLPGVLPMTCSIYLWAISTGLMISKRLFPSTHLIVSICFTVAHRSFLILT